MALLLGWAAISVTAQNRSSRTSAPLADLMDGLAAGRFRVVDLTHTLGPGTPVIQLPAPLANTPGFESHVISNFDVRGPAWYWNWFSVGEHVGTHFDAPCHWVSGRDQPCVDGLDATLFVGPAVVLDVTADVSKDADFTAVPQTILAWEQNHGRVPKRAWVILRTGWERRASAAGPLMNVGPDGTPHWPGFGKESAEFLIRERDVLGVGTDAVAIDAGIGTRANLPVHAALSEAGKGGLELLANLGALPEAGAILFVIPLKIERGSGSPVRAIAILSK